LRNTALNILDNPDFKPHLTPPRRYALERIIAGPLGVDIKHWESDPEGIAKAIDQFNASSGIHFGNQQIRLMDGRTVIKTSIEHEPYIYNLDFAQRVGPERSAVLSDYRAGPQQTSVANTSGYLIVDNGNNLFVALNPPREQNHPDTIHFPEYPEGFLQALCAAAKLARVKMLSSRRNIFFKTDSARQFSLRLKALLDKAIEEHEKDALILPNFRVTEFITDMLIAATASRNPPIKTMGRYGIVEKVPLGIGHDFINIMVRYGIVEALFPGGLKNSAQGRNCLDNLNNFNPDDPFSVMRFIQDMDPTNRFAR